MIEILKRILKKLTRFALAICSILILLSVLLIITAQGFIVWLNTNSGGNWLSSHIETILAEQPYRLDLKNFSLSGLLGVRAGQVIVRDTENDLLSVQNARIRIDPFPLAIRRLSLKITADQISVLNKPPQTEKKEQQAEKELNVTLPDIYFNEFALGIYIDHLIISDQIMKNGLDAVIEFEQLVSIEENTAQNVGKLSVQPLDNTQGIPLYLPLELTNKLAFDTETNILDVQDITLQNRENNITATGFYALNNKTFDLAANGVWQDVKALSADLSAPIKFDADINGDVTAFDGNALITTAYKNIPANITTIVSRQNDLLKLETFNATAKDLVIDGQASYDLSSKVADANIKGRIDSLEIVNTLTSQDIGGNGTFTLRANGNQTSQSAAIDMAFNNLRYKDMTAASITADITVPSVKNWKQSRGTISVRKAQVPKTTINSARIDIDSKPDAIHVKVSADARALKPFTINGEAALHSLEQLHIAIPSFKLTAGKGSLNLSGALQNNQPDFKLETNNLDLAALPYAELSSLPLKIKTLDARLSGTLDAPLFDLNYGVTSALPKAPEISLSGQASYKDQKTALTFSGEGQGIKTLQGNASFPLGLSLQPFKLDFDKTAALTGQVSGDLDLGALGTLFLPDTYDLSGDINLDADLSGDLSKPAINGDLTLRNAEFIDEVNDLVLRDLRADAAFAGQKITLQSLTANDKSGNGSLTASGMINLETPAEPDITADVTMKNMHVVQSNEFDVRLNADLGIETRASNYFLTGTITPQEIMINIPERFNNPIPTLNVVEREEAGAVKKRSFMEKLKMDLVFNADNQIFVRGWGLDAELAGKMDITGTAKTPLVNGQLRTIRGRYEELGKRFTIDRAIVRFQGKMPPSPYLDVKTSTELEDDITAHILITGRATDPKLEFAATPSLPEDEVLSRILFGQDPTNISAFQAVQLAQTLRRFSGKGGGGIDLLGKVRDVTGLDDIRVEGVGTENATVGAGKYITDKVYVEVEQGAGENSGAASVEIEVTPRITLESKTSQNGDSDVGVFWEWDY